MGGWGRRQAWATDYPKADRQFLVVLERLIDLDTYQGENPVLLTDPVMRRFPFLYAVEPGYMSLSPEEVEGLRNYLVAGGFLLMDDFWGGREWANVARELRRVFPEKQIVDVPMEHPVFHMVYDIEEIMQVPNRRLARAGGRTWERADAQIPFVRGILDDDGRLMVIINGNTDLGDAWEWAEDPYYPLKYSTFAYEMGVNIIVYAMSH
jgi:hypothetical protein